MVIHFGSPFSGFTNLYLVALLNENYIVAFSGLILISSPFYTTLISNLKRVCS